MSLVVPVPARQTPLDEQPPHRVEAAAARWKWQILAAFTTCYLAATCYRASRKLFWFDEIFTVELARLPDWGTLWEMLQRGLDFNPPLFYWMTRAAEHVAGNGHLGPRLPEIIGFGIFCLCLFRFVSRRSSVLGGLVAMVFPLATNAYWYAYEARPHAIALGFGGLALIFWQAAAEVGGRHRFWWLAGMSAALAAAILNHAFAVLLFVPLLAGELVRLYVRRRVDVPMGVALLLASGACVTLVPLARAAALAGVAQDPDDRWTPSLVQVFDRIGDSYAWHLGSGALLVAAVALVFACTDRARTRGEAARRPGLLAHEQAAAWTLMALPVFAVVLSLATGALYFDRYSLGFIGGFAVLVGSTAARVPGRTLAILGLLSMRIAADNFDYYGSSLLAEPSSRLRLYTYLPRLDKEYEALRARSDLALPIALLDGVDAPTMMRYAPPDLLVRMAYVMRGESDGLGRLYLRLINCCDAPGAVRSLSGFARSHPTFLAYGRARSLRRLQELAAAGHDVKVVSMSADQFMVLVHASRH